MLSFRRSKEWDIRKFWRKYRKIRAFAHGVGVMLPEDVAFTQAFKSLDSNPAHQKLILSMVGSAQLLLVCKIFNGGSAT